MVDTTDQNELIKNGFSAAADYYCEHADLQKQVAQRLANALEPWRYSINEGPILEIGAGTGFFTQHLVKFFSPNRLIVTDISDKMIDQCRESIGEEDKITYRQLDAENSEFDEKKYSLIAGNFVVQWFKYPGQTLLKMVNALKPGGLLLISFPGSESFRNWKSYCLDLGLPFTGNPLPDVEQLIIELSTGPVQVDFYEDTMTDSFDTVFDFFRYLKATGTGTSLSGKKLTGKQLRLLNNYWLENENGKAKVYYHTAFVAAKRDPES